MHKRRIPLLVGITCLVIVLLATSLVACTKAAPTPAPSPAPAPTPAPAQPLEMRLADPLPPVHIQNAADAIPWAEEVEKQTNGRLKMTVFPAEALGKGNQNYDLIMAGGADAGQITLAYTPGRFPLSEVTTLPFMNPPDRPVGAIWDLYKKFPELQKEYDPIKVFAMLSTDPIQLYTAKKPVRKLDDLKGMQIRVHDQNTGDLFKSLGASPVIVPIFEVYLQLQKGTLDGAVATLEACRPFKLQEVTKYVTLIGLSISPSAWGFNPDSWNKLPPDIQQLIGRDGALGGNWWTETNVAAYTKAMNEASGLITGAGMEIITLPPDEMAKLKAAGKVTVDKWIADKEAAGLPGQKIYDGLAEILINNYNYNPKE